MLADELLFKQQMQKIIRVSIWRLNPQGDMQNATMPSNMTTLKVYDGGALTEKVITWAFLFFYDNERLISLFRKFI